MDWLVQDAMINQIALFQVAEPVGAILEVCGECQPQPVQTLAGTSALMDKSGARSANKGGGVPSQGGTRPFASRYGARS